MIKIESLTGLEILTGSIVAFLFLARLFVFFGDSVTLKIIIKILKGVDFVDPLIYRQIVLPDGVVQHLFLVVFRLGVPSSYVIEGLFDSLFFRLWFEKCYYCG